MLTDLAPRLSDTKSEYLFFRDMGNFAVLQADELARKLLGILP